MVSMEINKTRIWYSNLIHGESEPVLDEHGLMTGDFVQRYTTPVPLRAALSESIGLNNLSAQGIAELDPYGITTNYTHRMVVEDMNCPLDEESIVWHDRDPGDNPYDVPYNFRVIRASKTLNYKMYYLRQVNTSGSGSNGT